MYIYVLICTLNHMVLEGMREGDVWGWRGLEGYDERSSSSATRPPFFIHSNHDPVILDLSDKSGSYYSG